MKFAVIVFPGSNCDHDAYYAAKHVLGQECEFIWHKEASLKGADAVILPGGFAHGDYLRTGAIAKFSPAMAPVAAFAAAGGPVLGICNGFQVMCEAGLLEGALLRNASVQYRCEQVHLRVEQTNTPFTGLCQVGQLLQMPVAHGEGNYYAAPDVLERLERDKQVIFRYVSADGREAEAGSSLDRHDLHGPNPNGSLRNIAGICNAARNVVGLMPHPDRACESVLGSADGLIVFESVVAYIKSGVPA
jgi:phosphoribosylformylglycinamidine synthase